MAKGRKPTPKQFKVIAGTDQPCRDRQDVPEYDIVDHFPDPPQHLNTDGAAIWDELGRQLVTARVLRVVDLYALEQLCYVWQRFRHKAKAGMDLTAAENQALKALYSEFGISPASRLRVPVAGTAKNCNPFERNGRPPENPFARFGKRPTPPQDE